MYSDSDAVSSADAVSSEAQRLLEEYEKEEGVWFPDVPPPSFASAPNNIRMSVKLHALVTDLGLDWKKDKKMLGRASSECDKHPQACKTYIERAENLHNDLTKIQRQQQNILNALKNGEYRGNASQTRRPLPWA